MARRRKKTKKPPSTIQPKVDKSLPALPPSAAPQFTPDVDTPSDVFSEPPTTDASPRPPHPRRNDSSPAANFRREASPASQNDARRGTSTFNLQPRHHLQGSDHTDEPRTDNVTLPASTYKEANHSEASDTGDDNGVMLPFALDPNTAPGPSPIHKTHTKPAEGKPGRDYFNRPVAGHREMLKENRSRSASADRQSASPHIAFQEKGRQPSDQLVDTLRKRTDNTNSSTDRTRSQHASPAPSQPTDAFKLQEVPKNKRAEARKNSTTHSPSRGSPPTDLAGRLAGPPTEATGKSPAPLDAQTTRDDDASTTSSSSFGSTQQRPQVERPARGDSLANSSLKSSAPVSRKDLSAASPTTPTMPQNDRKPSTTSAYSQQNGTYGERDVDPPVPPQRAAGRRPPPSTDTFVSPRAPPQPPPPPQNHKTSESVSTMHSDNSNNAYSAGGLPRYSAQGDFSMDEDFARLLSNQEGHEKEGGMLRKVSNAMKGHGRSYSDRGSITSRGHGHKKWPTNGSIDISSPMIASPNSNEEAVNLRNELRRAQQRIAELEAEKNGLQESVHSAADIKQANTMLREKRNTIAVLDTQREMVIRELEIMTEHLKKAKESSGSAMDINQLKSDILRDFAGSLQKLKDQLGGQIEELISKRTALTDEISNLIQMKDKGFQEYESLSAQNKKLADMNQSLIESIQGTLKTNKQHIGNQSIDAARSPANGLGIYGTNHKGGKSDISVDAREVVHEQSYSNLHEADNEATLAQPQVVNIRKTGKATKFSNWKKGGQAITKNVTKGFKGAFGPTETKPAEEMSVKVIGTPYGSTHSQPDFASMTTMSNSLKSKEEAPPRGWFGGKGAPTNPKDRMMKPMHQNDSSTNLVDASVLFGSDLSSRCDYEKRMIPAIVSRCIEEVEARGMDVEGIYRKSGGTSQVNQVKSGFEANDEFDISDPDLDIHAVTSTLKSYFRRLPVPLIAYSVYDQFLEAGAIEVPEQRARALRAAINEIPRAHRDTMQFLIFHLSRVIQHSSDNLVSYPLHALDLSC